MSNQGPPSIEAQAEDLARCVEAFDKLIEDTGRVIDLHQQQRAAFIEKRAEFNALRSLLASSVGMPSKSGSPVLEGLEAAAIAVGTGILSGHPIAATILSGEILINNALDERLKEVDEQNARIEQTLEEQREWFREHQGRQGG